MRMPAAEAMIRELVALPSVSSVQPALDTSNRPVCETLAGWLEDLGFRVAMHPVPGREGKLNLLARTGDGPGGLVLAGHTDTVPYDAGRWQGDPFELRREDGRLHGLGVADMKSFFALAARAAEAAGTRGLRAPLAIVATADEESTMSGARALAGSGEAPGAMAVIGEPTGLRPVYAHKGIMMERIRVIGRSGHSSNPALGASALEGMLEVADELRRFRAQLAADHSDARFEVAAPTLNLGRIAGGDSPNRICGECELVIDLRPTPAMDLRATRERLRRRVSDRLRDSGLEVAFEALLEGVPSMRPGEGPLLAACEAESGEHRHAVCFGTEAPFFQDLGMEVVVMGPGSIDVAHQPDEYLELDQAERCEALLGRLIHRFCIEATGDG